MRPWTEQYSHTRPVECSDSSIGLPSYSLGLVNVELTAQSEGHMNWHFVTITATFLILFYRDDLLRYLHHVEDILMPLDPLDLSIFNDMEQKADGLVIRGTDYSYLNCSDLQASTNETLASGWSKLVEVLSHTAVLKRPNLDGRAFQDCFHANFGNDDWETRCKLELLKGFISEIKVLLKLRNASNVIMLMSYCIPRNPLENFHRLNIVTERGKPLDALNLVQLSLQQRHEFANEIRRFFISNPTLRLHDFRRQQFFFTFKLLSTSTFTFKNPFIFDPMYSYYCLQIVLANGKPKIVDFDGAYFSDENADADEYHSDVLRKLNSEILLNASSTFTTRSSK